MELQKNIIRKLLQSKSELISEEIIAKLIPNSQNYQDVLSQIGLKLAELGIELIRTTFEGKKYFMLGIQSDSSPIPEDLLGVLIFITAYLKEHNEKASQDQFESIFSDVIEEVNQLVKMGYILKTDQNYILHPRTKVLLKTIYRTLEFEKLF